MNTFFTFISLLMLQCSGNWCPTTIGYRQDDGPVIIHDSKTIQSINDLSKLFPGKPFYVDLWATWCEPCHEEFKYSREVYNNLKKADVQVVYIAFNRDGQDSAWRADIHKYKLAGHHILAGKSLQDSLTKLIWGAKDAYSIPHYLLFDSNGRLVDKSAPEPHTGQQLFDFIEKKLKD